MEPKNAETEPRRIVDRHYPQIILRLFVNFICCMVLDCNHMPVAIWGSRNIPTCDLVINSFLYYLLGSALPSYKCAFVGFDHKGLNCRETLNESSLWQLVSKSIDAEVLDY